MTHFGLQIGVKTLSPLPLPLRHISRANWALTSIITFSYVRSAIYQSCYDISLFPRYASTIFPNFAPQLPNCYQVHKKRSYMTVKNEMIRIILLYKILLLNVFAGKYHQNHLATLRTPRYGEEKIQNFVFIRFFRNNEFNWRILSDKKYSSRNSPQKCSDTFFCSSALERR